MPPVLRRIRRQMPWLTPTYAGDDEQDNLFARLKFPRLQQSEPIDEALTEGVAIPALRRPPLTAVPPLVTMPTRISDERIDEIGAPPMVVRRDGRPTTEFIGEGTPEERLLTRRRALEVYQPQKESKKSLLLRTLLGQLRGGLIGEGGSLDTLLGPAGVLDRRGKDRAWQQGELARTDESLGRMRTDKRVALQDDYLQSQIDENRAQAAKALREPTVPPLKPTNIFTGAEDVEDEAGNVIMVGPDGKPILNPATGEPYVRRRLRAPAVKPEKPDTSAFTNEQISRTIAEIETEQKTLGPSPPTEIEDRDNFGVVIGKKVNPAYLDWARRYRELDDKKRDLQLKRKPTGATVPAVTTPRSSGITEQAIRDAAKAKGLDPEQAVKRARSRGMIR